MTHILLIFTGGTIGSAAINGTIGPLGQAPFQLLELFRQHYNKADAIDFTVTEPMRVLSENLTPLDWADLIRAIEKENPKQYDGIIITHGTDTLAFTAAALSFYFAGLHKPILLVSSNYPLARPEANGFAHFICAVEFIRQLRLPGVFVPYQNPGQSTQVHLGTRLASSPQLSGDFFGVQHKSFLLFENGRFSGALLTSPEQKQTTDALLKPIFYRRLLLIKPYPGLDYSFFNIQASDVILHDLYHSGTACVSAQRGQQWALPAFIDHCRQSGAAVYLAPALKSEQLYETTQALIEAGGEMIWNTSLESAYAKLALAYGNYDELSLIKSFLEKDIAGEHIKLDVNMPG